MFRRAIHTPYTTQADCAALGNRQKLSRPEHSPSAFVVALIQQMDGLLHRPPGPAETPLVDRQLVPACVDGLLQTHDGQVGQLVGDPLQPTADLVELTRHDVILSRVSTELA